MKERRLALLERTTSIVSHQDEEGVLIDGAGDEATRILVVEGENSWEGRGEGRSGLSGSETQLADGI